jgi:hypothetical protein
MNRKDAQLLEEIEAKVDALLDDTEDLLSMLQDIDERAARRSAPMKWSFPMLLFLLSLAALFSSAVYATTAKGQLTRMGACIGALVEDINPSLMSMTTSTRKARGICENLQRTERDFFRAMTE